MREIIEKYWRELQKKLAPEQVFYLFIMLIFLEYQKCRQGRYQAEDFTQQYFIHAFDDIYDYDFKEAVHRFSEKVDWFSFENDKDVQDSLQDVGWRFFNYIKRGWDGTRELPDRRNLCDLLNLVLELEGRFGGYTATPMRVRQLITDLVDYGRAASVTELCCGTAVLGAELLSRLSLREPKMTFYGVDIDAALCDIAKINLYFSGIRNGRIEQKDLLVMPDKAIDEQSDIVLMDIPRGNNIIEAYDSRDFRLMHFNKKNIYSDWIFIQDVLYRLSDRGRAAVLATSGALIRMNEKILREQIVLNDWLEAVISLPANLYPKERTGTELLIFNKMKDASRRGKIIFIDISAYYYRAQRNAYSISEEGIDIARKCFRYGKQMEGISVIQDIKDMDSNACSFKPIQYIQQRTGVSINSSLVLQDIAAITRGAQVLSRDIVQEDGTAFFINIKDIRENRIQYDTADRISPQHPACKKKYRIEEDDILITSKGTALKMAIVEKKPPLAYISGNITLIRVDKSKYDPYVLLEYLDGEQGRMELERIQSGTTIRILSNASLQKIKVPEYDLTRIQQIGKKLKEKQAAYYEEQKKLTEDYQSERRVLLDLLREE